MLLISLASTLVMYTVVFATARNQQRRMTIRMMISQPQSGGLPNDVSVEFFELKAGNGLKIFGLYVYYFPPILQSKKTILPQRA